MRWRIYAVVFAIIAIMLVSMLFVGDTIDRYFEGRKGSNAFAATATGPGSPGSC